MPFPDGFRNTGDLLRVVTMARSDALEGLRPIVPSDSDLFAGWLPIPARRE